jgi:DNA polymerase
MPRATVRGRGRGRGARHRRAAGERARRVPALCEHVVLHRDPDRFGLLYRLLWRLQTEPALRHDALDADWVAAQQMAQAVRRDMHKMTAFVRFRELDEGDGRPPLHVAWFEPEHRIVEATAPFFARRFANMRWAILTPERSVRWDGEQLAFGPARAATRRRPPTRASRSGSPTTAASSIRRG